MKRPSFQFYPSDWLRDTALRSCSIGARGLWIDMICYMHEGNPYGHLKVGNKVILAPNLASMVGSTLDVVEGWLDELFQAGVFQYAEDNAIFSKRMIRDESLRQSRAAGGIKGGNPNLKDNHKVNLQPNLKDETKVKQKPTPSSSSSSSSTKDIYTQEFEEFWDFYPQKTGKGEAYKSWKKIKPDARLRGLITIAVGNYKLSKKVKEGFVKNPATWLNQRCWEDETQEDVAVSPFAGDI